MRRCLDCPAIGAWRRGRCPTHDRARDKARGTKAQRGYGPEHQRERRRIQRLIDAGEDVRCWRCGIQLTGHDWHLDHDDDRSRYRGPACAPCNLHLAGRAAHGG